MNKDNRKAGTGAEQKSTPPEEAVKILKQKRAERIRKETINEDAALDALMEEPVNVPIGPLKQIEKLPEEVPFDGWTFFFRPTSLGKKRKLSKIVRDIFTAAPDVDTMDEIEQAMIDNFDRLVDDLIELVVILASDGIPEREPISVKIGTEIVEKPAEEVREYLEHHLREEHVNLVILYAFARSNIGGLLKNAASLDMMTAAI